MTVTRRQAREWAIQLLTAADLNPPDDRVVFLSTGWEFLADVAAENGEACEIGGKLKAFAEERIVGVLESMKEIDDTLSGLLDNWDLYRLGTIERVVLRMGVWELSHTDVPKAVVINEAIDLANWFSSPKTRVIVNGVLDKYARSR